MLFWALLVKKHPAPLIMGADTAVQIAGIRKWNQNI